MPRLPGCIAGKQNGRRARAISDKSLQMSRKAGLISDKLV